MDSLVEDIKSLLNINGGMFISMAIEDYLADINPLDYKDFFRELSGDKFSYKTGMDRVAIVSSSFKARKDTKLNSNVNSSAKILFDKLWSVKQQVCDKYEGIKYDAIKDNDGIVFKNNEMIIINKLNMSDIMKQLDTTRSPNDTMLILSHEMEKVNQASIEGMALSLNDKKLLK